MFEVLLGRYLGNVGGPTAGSITDCENKLLTLELVLDNFQESFDPEPMFYQLHKIFTENAESATESTKTKWQSLDERLIHLATGTSSRQAATLGRIGGTVDQILVPIASEAHFTSDSDDLVPPRSVRISLYSLENLTGVGEFISPVSEQPLDHTSENKRYSISIEVHGLTQISAAVSVFIWKDHYSKTSFVAAESHLVKKLDFEVSYVISPYMDNTLIGCTRFALIYKGCLSLETADQECHFPLKRIKDLRAQFQVLTFSEQFLSQRDRPYMDELLQKASVGGTW